MGNGLVRRYRASPEGGYDHNAWRQPKPKSKARGSRSPAKDQAKATASQDSSHSQWRQPKQREAPGAARPVPSAGARAEPPAMGSAASASGGAQSVAEWSKASVARDPVPLAAPDDDDDDISGCSNLADAAAKVWEELMVKRECAKDVGALFYLGELKDGVERAAKRVDVLRREASAAAQKVDEKETALSELCSHIEEKSIANGSIAQWKLGDMAIRRGKGFCELSMVHHEADPPYYEVRMVTTGSVVGVEAGNLLELQPQQKSLVRNALREVEQAKARAVSAEECEVQAQEELKKQHQALTEQVEKKLQDSASTAATQPSAAAAAPVGGRSAPPGLPDMDLVRRWGGRGAIPSTAAKPEAMPAVADYPDMRGLREDFRSPSLPEANTTPRVTGTAPAPTPTVPPGAPVGFPSLEELQRMEGRAAAERERQATAATYPSAHPAAASALRLIPQPGGRRSLARGSRRRTAPPHRPTHR